MNNSIRCLLASACAIVVLSSAGCERHESLEAESRDLGDYTAIDLRGAAEIKISVGQPSSLKIEGSDYAVKGLRTEVRDNTLYIEAKKTGWAWFGDGDELRLTISMQKLLSLSSSGAGSIKMSGLNGGDQIVRIAGAHNLEASGQLDKLTIELDGAGNVDYGKVTTQDANVTVNGAGHVLVRTTQFLSATMNGVGAIQYEGNPQKVESSIHGVGSISRR
jgi:hypothetical protein